MLPCAVLMLLLVSREEKTHVAFVRDGRVSV